MDGHNVILPKASSNIANESVINVLLIGIRYSRKILDQWKSCTSLLDKACVDHNLLAVGIVPALNKFVRLDPITNALTEYSMSVKREFLRGLLLEDMYNPFMVHCVTLCTYSIRDSLKSSHYKMNCNVYSRDFLNRLRSKGLRLDQICIDHYRMLNEYFANNFG